jgi:peptidoglycan/LPS O-acetylase OafA/YrhL
MAVHPKPNYRSDIDGLRALAVLLVLFFHLDLHHFAGGFIGVDVFFVISGFLISGILLRELDAGTFSFATFYERRIRRIAPALLALLLITTPLAYHFFFPPDFHDYANTLLAALFSVSNLYLLQSENYFDVANQSRPLLHTWSLGIEEQYYLVFPLILIAIRRWAPSKRSLILWSLAFLSFAATCIQMKHSKLAFHMSTAFFLSPLRAWELLLGTMIYDLPVAKERWRRELLAFAGVLLILIPALTYSAGTWFPGPGALPPCLGAALILHAGRHGSSLTAKALSWKPFAFIGLISYSLYLIHWPLIVFQQQTQFLLNESLHPGWVKPVLLLVSLVLATLSWRFIETPFRRGRLRPTRPLLYAMTAAAFTVLLAAGLDIQHYNGWKMPHIPYTRESARFAAFQFPKMEPPFGPGNCFVQVNQISEFDAKTCLTDDPARQNFLLFGDSHALVLYPGLKQAFPQANISLASMVGCRPIVTPSPWVAGDCNAFNSLVFKDFVLHHPHVHILLVDRWGWWSESDLAETIAYLKAHSIPVSVIGPAIEFDASLPRLVSIADRQHSPAVYSKHLDHEQQALDQHLASLARSTWHVPYISAYEDLCDRNPSQPDPVWQVRTTNGCPVFGAPGIPLLSDGHHFTPSASTLFATAMRNRHQLP